MSNIGIGSSPNYQVLAPSYSPLGKPAAGLESAENKDQTLPPVEESSASEKNRNQPHRKADAASEKDESKSKNRQPSNELTEAEQQQVRELAAIDREVRAHEAAHQTVGGSLAGAASFRFAIGPDGARYAVSGEVPISIVTVAGDPQATIRNAKQVRAAALAPAQPSAQDRSIAVEAVHIIAQAQFEAALHREVAAPPGDDAKTDGGSAVDRFKSNTSPTLAPGSLLDQRS